MASVKEHEQFFSSFPRIPEDWTHVGRVNPTEELELIFALKQQNVNLLEETLSLVSDPDSASYGLSDDCRLSLNNPEHLGCKNKDLHTLVELRSSVGFVSPLF